jgi:hypothetical protein
LDGSAGISFGDKAQIIVAILVPLAGGLYAHNRSMVQMKVKVDTMWEWFQNNVMRAWEGEERRRG